VIFSIYEIITIIIVSFIIAPCLTYACRNYPNKDKIAVWGFVGVPTALGWLFILNELIPAIFKCIL